MPTYEVPKQTRYPSPIAILVRFALKAVKIAAIAYAVLWGHFLAYFLIAPVYFILAFGAIFFQILPQAIYVRLTGRRIVWLERIQPFSRETKLSADEMKERRLTERD